MNGTNSMEQVVNFVNQWWKPITMIVGVTIIIVNFSSALQAHDDQLAIHEARAKQELRVLRVICRRLSFSDSQRAECNAKEDE